MPKRDDVIYWARSRNNYDVVDALLGARLAENRDPGNPYRGIDNIVRALRNKGRGA